MSKGGQVTVCEHIFTYTYIYTYKHYNKNMILFVKCCIHLPLPPGSIAYMKQTAHQKHLKVCLFKNLKVVPLDRYSLERS